MKELKIKKFNELSLEELYSILRARAEVFVLEQKITSEEEFDGIDDKCIHIFLEEDKKVIAYCRIVPKGISYENISIGRVLVKKEYRRKGIAQEILNEAIQYIKTYGNESRIVLSAQLYAKKVYENVGFVQNSDVYIEAEIPHVKMYKDL